MICEKYEVAVSTKGRENQHSKLGVKRNIPCYLSICLSVYQHITTLSRCYGWTFKNLITLIEVLSHFLKALCQVCAVVLVLHRVSIKPASKSVSSLYQVCALGLLKQTFFLPIYGLFSLGLTFL